MAKKSIKLPNEKVIVSKMINDLEGMKKTLDIESLFTKCDAGEVYLLKIAVHRAQMHAKNLHTGLR